MADDIPVKGVHTSLSSDGNRLPLFITPKNGNDSVIFLKYWVKMNKSWLEKKVLEHGTLYKHRHYGTRQQVYTHTRSHHVIRFVPFRSSDVSWVCCEGGAEF